MIVLSNIAKHFGAKILYDDISGSINPQYRTGLIGPNGCGKTFLLRVLAGEESVESGEVNIPPDLRLGYLPQEMDFDETVSPLRLVLTPFQHLLEADESLHHLFDVDTQDPKALTSALRHFDNLQNQMAIHDIHSVEARAKKILAGLGVPQECWEAPVTTLSGGYRMRVVLAQLLLCEPDYLLLDEPTNHLDMDSLVWLERYLTKFRGGALVVSHDRTFLQRICTHTSELANGRLTQYNGPVNDYFVWKEERDALNARRTAGLEAQINQAERFIERFKAKNTKSTAAKSKEKLINRLKDQMPDQDKKIDSIRFRLPTAIRSGTVPVKIENATIGYDGKPVLKNVTLNVNRGDKLAIIGPNGTGKSTLLKAIAGLLPLQDGNLAFATNVYVRLYSQHRLDQLNPEYTCYQTIQEAAGTTNKTFLQSLLGQFLFSGDEVEKRVSVLSGGEKSRLCLASILANPGNVLLLDEPTNHLDIQSIEQLSKTLAEFDGTILLVSHDEYFVSKIATRIIEMRPGVMRDFPGTLDDYRSYIEQGYLAPLLDLSQDPGKKSSAQNDESERRERIKRREDRKKLERRVEKTERSVMEIEERIAKTKLVMDDPSNATNHELLQQTFLELSQLNDAHDALIKEWESAAAELEKITDGD
jgi:ATP-binding cassette, subfamily F, member 3